MRLKSMLLPARNVIAACALSIGLVSVATPATSAAPGTGWLRLAHLSPNTPAVDVYLYSANNPRAVFLPPGQLWFHDAVWRPRRLSPTIAVLAAAETISSRKRGILSQGSARPVGVVGLRLVAQGFERQSAYQR